MHFAHFGQVAHRHFEFTQRIFRLALQAHHGENRDGKTELRGVEFGVITPDYPVLFESAYTAQTGRRGQSDAMGEFYIGDSPFILEFTEQSPVDFVEIGHIIRSCYPGATGGASRNFHEMLTTRCSRLG